MIVMLQSKHGCAEARQRRLCMRKARARTHITMFTHTRTNTHTRVGKPKKHTRTLRKPRESAGCHDHDDRAHVPRRTCASWQTSLDM